MTGGSRCYTCYTQSWPDLQKASCRNTSPGPTSRHLQGQEMEFTKFVHWSQLSQCNICTNTRSHLSPPWCPHPLLIHLRLGRPPASPCGTLFCFRRRPPPSVPLPPLLQCLAHPSICAHPWAPLCREMGWAESGDGWVCWCHLQAPLLLFGHQRRRGTAALELSCGPADFRHQPVAPSPFSSSFSSVSQLSCDHLDAGWWSCAAEEQSISVNIWDQAWF